MHPFANLHTMSVKGRLSRKPCAIVVQRVLGVSSVTNWNQFVRGRIQFLPQVKVPWNTIDVVMSFLIQWNVDKWICCRSVRWNSKYQSAGIAVGRGRDINSLKSFRIRNRGFGQNRNEIGWKSIHSVAVLQNFKRTQKTRKGTGVKGVVPKLQ